LRGFARVFRIGRPRALLLTGRELEISGGTQTALRATNKSLACALRLGMPYEEALARRQLGKLLPAADPQKSHQLKQALALFSRLGSQGEGVRSQESEVRSQKPRQISSSNLMKSRAPFQI
jgi:hypothetical protein